MGVERREKALRELGLRVVPQGDDIRFGNDEVVRNVSVVMGIIKSLVSE